MLRLVDQRQKLRAEVPHGSPRKVYVDLAMSVSGEEKLAKNALHIN